MRTFALFLGACLALPAFAQRTLFPRDYTEPLRTNHAAAAHFFSILNTPKPAANTTTSGITSVNPNLAESPVVHIPVVVHLLYNTDAQNISDAQIKSGIAALNRDYRRQNSDTVNTPARFKGRAADVEIEFQLATADPYGRPTTGILRKQSPVLYFDMDDKIKHNAQGGDDAWDTKSYLNIWLGDLRSLLGYGTMPGSDSAVDGVVINTSAFGTINTAPPYNLGRTAVHEVGHWLGLYHLWGDQACGDDFVDDTPKQGGYTSGCPTGFRSSCNNGPDGDMYMNYMDFTNDGCMNLFTQGQKARMRSQFDVGGARYAILASKGLNEPWMEALPLPSGDSVFQNPMLQVYPNPVVSEVVLQSNVAPNASGNILYLMSATGVVMQKINLNTRVQKLTLTNLQTGVYFLQGTLNGAKVNKKLVKL